MKPENIIAQKRIIACLLTFCGGFIDSYTYMLRGHTLSAGQTGNVIFFASSFANGNVTGMINRGSTILAFMVGLVLSVLLQSRIKSAYWRIIEMIPLILITFLMGFIPTNVSNYKIVPLIALGMAMQSGSFKKINGLGYSNVFTSGNIKKSVLSLSQFYILDDISQKEIGIDYLFVVTYFVLGAIISAILQKVFYIHTIWIASLILIVVNLLYWILVERSLKNEHFSLLKREL